MAQLQALGMAYGYWLMMTTYDHLDEIDARLKITGTCF
jgi:hypothetical protein